MSKSAEELLLEYGSHNTGCPAPLSSPLGEYLPCTCGFTAALRSITNHGGEEYRHEFVTRLGVEHLVLSKLVEGKWRVCADFTNGDLLAWLRPALASATSGLKGSK